MFKVGQTYATTAPDGRTATVVHIMSNGRIAYVSTSKAGAEYVQSCGADGNDDNMMIRQPFLIAPDVTEDFFV